VFRRAVRYLTARYGVIDLHLLASVLITPGAKLWTLDKRLARLAERFGWLTQKWPHWLEQKIDELK
jgi:hypothetical protein